MKKSCASEQSSPKIHKCDSPDLSRDKFCTFKVFTSQSFIYLVGGLFSPTYDEAAKGVSRSSVKGLGDNRYRDSLWKILRFDKRLSSCANNCLGDSLEIDDNLYQYHEIADALANFELRETRAGQQSGGLNTRKSSKDEPSWTLDAVALLGCVRFITGFYLVLVLDQTEEGNIQGHTIYSCKGTKLLPLFDEKSIHKCKSSTLNHHSSRNEFNSRKNSVWAYLSAKKKSIKTAEKEFIDLFEMVNLNKAFYWSRTYDLCQSLQNNVANWSMEMEPYQLEGKSQYSVAPKDDLVWNSFLYRPLLDALGHGNESPWIVKLMHGSFSQKRFTLFSRSFILTLISRRSRHFAGTRYLKRGLNDQGQVANDVEVEQIVSDSQLSPDSITSSTSFVQMRGSIPTFWTQEGSVATPKPPITQLRSDPWYLATRKHFCDLFSRYGDAIFVLNLVRQNERTEREKVVGNDYRHAIEQINAALPDDVAVRYRAIDFARLSKTNPGSLRDAIELLAEESLRKTNFFTINTCKRVPTFLGGKWLSKALTKDEVLLKIFLPPQSRSTELGAKFPQRWSAGKGAFVTMRDSISKNIEEEFIDMSHVYLTRRSLDSIQALSESSLVEEYSSDEETYTGYCSDDADVDLDHYKLPLPNGKNQDSSVAPQRSNRFSPVLFFKESLQRGVIRTNCIDCLDRTNAAQCLIGLRVLSEQLVALRAIKKSERISSESKVASLLSHMYEEMGDFLAMQYGGSEAYRKGKILTPSSANSTKRHQTLYTMLRRHYSNVFTDQAKQDGINVFLGLDKCGIEMHGASSRLSNSKHNQSGSYSRSKIFFRPHSHHPNDFYLHNLDVTQPPSSEMSLRVIEYHQENWWSSHLATFFRHRLLPTIVIYLESSERDLALRFSGKRQDFTSALFSLDDFFARSRAMTQPILNHTIVEDDVVNSSEAMTETSSNVMDSEYSERDSQARIPQSSFISTADQLAKSTDIFQNYLYDNSIPSQVMKRGHEICPVEKDYLQQCENPFEYLFESPISFKSQNHCEHWKRDRSLIECYDSLSDYSLSADDVWGMRRLQAYASTTNVIMHGRYKGYSRTFPATLFALNECQGLVNEMWPRSTHKEASGSINC